ncbi:Type I secretion system protein TolC [Endozoicomonas sp. Mp262]|uniref:Type I secretion system protein TolC n=1 Tax=Endozoicomonas sp. Mp262 TaxID=2919499 RepID=UPI0021DA0830
MTRARRQLVDLGSMPYYHCMAWCVRRAFLCGEDHLTGKSFEHRKAWVVDRLKVLTGVFTIEVRLCGDVQSLPCGAVCE